MQEERRKLPRQRTFKGGTILFDQAGTMDCVVRNLTTVGACLEVERAAALPNGFSLIIKPEIIKRSCEVVWRAASRVGVQFKS
jgi:hypothetical protein